VDSHSFMAGGLRENKYAILHGCGSYTNPLSQSTGTGRRKIVTNGWPPRKLLLFRILVWATMPLCK
jgi:hypothetical protein